MTSKPLVIAHRGGSPSDIENSAAAFEHALALGVDMLECDVRQTADDALVLLHDATVRMNGRRVVVADASFADLRSTFPWLLTLDDFLEGYGRLLPFNLDLKTHGYERDALAALRRHNVVDQTLVSTVHTHSLRRLSAVERSLGLGLSRGHLSSSVPARTATLGLQMLLPTALPVMARLAHATAVMLQWRVVTPELVVRMQRRGYQVCVWTVDNPDMACRLASWGVDGIASNVPGDVLQALGRPSSLAVLPST